MASPLRTRRIPLASAHLFLHELGVEPGRRRPPGLEPVVVVVAQAARPPRRVDDGGRVEELLLRDERAEAVQAGLGDGLGTEVAQARVRQRPLQRQLRELVRKPGVEKSHNLESQHG